MKVVHSGLQGVMIVETPIFADDRGWFMESYHAGRLGEAFSALGVDRPGEFVQDNHSLSHEGVLRGLHYQLPPHAQGKLVRVTSGAVFDVAVDVRRASPGFGRWIGLELSAENRRQLWIPPGFAHGFFALENSTQLVYKCTKLYCRESEASIAWNDEDIGITWPTRKGSPILSDKDAAAPSLRQARTF